MAHKPEDTVSQPRNYTLIVEKDVQIPVRDGTTLFADVFRPDGGSERFPAIINTGPYQKDKVWVPPPDVEEEANPYMNWETANPLWWCARGYALVRIDSRGSGKSPGRSEPSSYQEALDTHDCIEWSARQGWCDGNIGALGISYHASFQWRVAGLKPPSLKAIMPWEGRADQYRDQAYHGGIFAAGFIGQWWLAQAAHHLLGEPRAYNPDAFDNNLLWNFMRANLDSEHWRLCSARWDNIVLPVYSVGNWGGVGMHLRGNTEAYMCAASKNKKLRIHTGSHFHPFHSEEGRLEQLRWFDHWLKGIDTGLMDEPPVKLEIRTGGKAGRYAFRMEDDWPIPCTQWTRMYLRSDAEGHAQGGVEGWLDSEGPGPQSEMTYPASMTSRHFRGERTGLSFEWTMADDTEITGPIVLNLWVSSTSKDMDIFATIRNMDPQGKDVCEVGQRGEPVACVTKGWLRASHRKLDPAKTLPYRPYHAHDERLWLKPGEVVECQVEVWPTSMVFMKGHRLRLDISPRDGAGSGHFTHYHADYNAQASNTIHTGENTPSYLLLPVIPPR